MPLTEEDFYFEVGSAQQPLAQEEEEQYMELD